MRLQVASRSTASGQPRLEVLPSSLRQGRLQLPQGALQSMGSSLAPRQWVQKHRLVVAGGWPKWNASFSAAFGPEWRTIEEVVMDARTLDAHLLLAMVPLLDDEVLMVDEHKTRCSI